MSRLARVIAILFFVAVAVALLVAIVNAQDSTTPPTTNHTISPEQAMMLERLVLQRQVIEERAGRLVAEAELLKRDYAVKGQELDAQMATAAKAAGVDLRDGWRPDLQQKRWVKP